MEKIKIKRSSKLQRTRKFTASQEHAYKSAKLWGNYFLHAAFTSLDDFSLLYLRKKQRKQQAQLT